MDRRFIITIRDFYSKESYTYKGWAESIGEMKARAENNLSDGEDVELVEECGFSEDDEIDK